MPRDGAGNYTLPPGINPVIPGTVIEADWANPTMNDLAVAMTDSLSRTGFGGMLVPFLNTDGTVGAPGMTWVNEPSSGWYRAALNDFWYSVGNENIFRITKAGIELAPGKLATGIASYMDVQDAMPAGMKQGQQWWESDTAGFYFRYVNPDLTETLVSLAAAGGDFLPFAMRGAANGVASLDGTTKVPVAQLPTGGASGIASLDAAGKVTETQLRSIAGSHVRGSFGNNNGAFPNSIVDFRASEIVMRPPVITDRVSDASTNPPITNCNITLAGPVNQGRDQAAAFGANTWIHFYWIGSPTVTGTIASLSAPDVGPTLPATFTRWAYICPWRLDGGANLMRMTHSGNRVYYNQPDSIVAAGGATVETPIAAATRVPPNAVSYSLAAALATLTTDGSGSFFANAQIRIVTGSPFFQIINCSGHGMLAAQATNIQAAGPIEVPNILQTFFYLWSAVIGSGPQLTLQITSFSIANGGQ